MVAVPTASTAAASPTRSVAVLLTSHRRCTPSAAVSSFPVTSAKVFLRGPVETAKRSPAFITRHHIGGRNPAEATPTRVGGGGEGVRVRCWTSRALGDEPLEGQGWFCWCTSGGVRSGGGGGRGERGGRRGVRRGSLHRHTGVARGASTRHSTCLDFNDKKTSQS